MQLYSVPRIESSTMLRPKVADALSYLDLVKARFSNQHAIYTEFLDVMREFKAQTIGTDVVIRRVRELFDGHPDLIDGFNTFIPQGYRMECSSSSRPLQTPAPVVSTIAPISYSTEVISPSKLPSFSAFRHSDVAIETAASPPVQLSFVNSGADSSSRTNYYTTSCPLNANSPSQPPLLRSHLTTTTTDSHTLHPLNVGSASPTQPLNTVAILENPDALRGSTPSHVVFPQTYISNVQQQQHQAQSFNHAIIYVNKVKNRFQAKPDVYKSFLEILQWYQREQGHTDSVRRKKAEQQVYQDVAKLLHGHEDLLQEFSRFLPESTGVASDISDVGTKGVPYGSVSELSTAVHLGSSHGRFAPGGLPPPPDSQWHRVSDSSPNLSSPGLGPQSSGAGESKKIKRVAQSSASHAGVSTEPNIAIKKSRQSVRDVSIADTASLFNGGDATLLQKIRDALEVDVGGGSRSYQSLLQNISLFNRKLITESQLIDTAKVLLQRFPELWRQFRDLFSAVSPEVSSRAHNISSPSDQVGYRVCTPDREGENEKRAGGMPSSFQSSAQSNSLSSPPLSDANITHPLAGPDNAAMIALVSEVSQRRLDLDFNKLRTCGASYRALPADFPQPKCSGRAKSAIARTVLNDSYISFSSLTSEDSQFVSSKKNQYEENMYHTEDERYEADMIMEVNRAALQNLIVVKRRIDRMSRDEQQNFHLDDLLGGTSAILMKKAIHRVYGDKAGDVIYGLKTCPATVVPIVIQRMRQKDNEWREAVRSFHRIWSDQDAKNYLRSLDHQGASFKQRDNPFLRTKTVINQIEAIARGEQSQSSESDSPDPIGCLLSKCLISCSSAYDSLHPGSLGSALSHVVEGIGDDGGMHMTLEYPPPSVCASLLEDVASLIIHHVKRQSNTSKEDKRAMKFLVRTVLQDLFMQERFPMSDDEDDEVDRSEDSDAGEEEADKEGPSNLEDNASNSGRRSARRTRRAARTVSQTNGKSGAKASPPNSLQQSVENDANNRLSQDPSKPGPEVNVTPEADHTRATADAHFVDRVQNTRPGVDFNSKMPMEEYYSLFYGNNHWYAFLRLHHLLLTRLSQLRSRAIVLQEEHTKEGGKSNPQAAEVLRLRKAGCSEPKEHYHRALNLVKDLLDGCEDIQTYEDRLRDMFGIYAYPWFTMDRLVTNLVRQLHLLASGDELSHRLTSLFRSYFKSSSSRSVCGGNKSRHEPESCDLMTRSPIPVANAICGPLKTRFMRLKEEARFRHNALAACLGFAVSSSGTDTNGSHFNSEGILDRPTSVPNCYAMVMLRNASKFLIRLLDPSVVLNCTNDSHAPLCYSPVHMHPNTAPEEGVRATHALQRAINDSSAEARHWYDYLAKYLLLPGCWTAGPLSPSVLARIRPVFLYRNVKRCVNRLTHQAVLRRQQELITTGDPQPEEILLRRLSETSETPLQIDEQHEPAASSTPEAATPSQVGLKGNLEKDIWELMVGVFRNNLTHTELFRDTFSSDCMQSSTNLSVKSASKAYKINWSVGSYGIFVRRKSKNPTCSNRPSKKFRDFQARWLREHFDPQQMAQISKQFNRPGCDASSACENPKPDTEITPSADEEPAAQSSNSLSKDKSMTEDSEFELVIMDMKQEQSAQKNAPSVPAPKEQPKPMNDSPNSLPESPVAVKSEHKDVS
uniref:Histone deacetylase interacting domain-containing protein n=1 Tax=Schistocephalus solidus TaxID=70667 RepID=A0A0X3PJQ5_SCHSO